ncbi:MAG: hypothetical protein M1834_002983 [Cirrosporium novae-zelandiae]|nr:MAG: hypothetical protein M1834_002983 [Cirrosporium novae-zelandiae]
MESRLGSDYGGVGRDENESFSHKPTPPRGMVGRCDQIWNKKVRKFHNVKTAKQREKKARFRRYVILVRRRISTKGQVIATEVDIQGPILRQVLSEIHKETQGLSFHKDLPVLCPEILYHSKQGLVERLKKEQSSSPENEDTIFEIKSALQFIEEEYGSSRAKVEKLLANHEVTFDLLWTIFPPNTIVYGSKMLGQPRAWVSRSIELEEIEADIFQMVLRAEYLDFDGKNLGYVGPTKLVIPRFPNTMRISDLPFFPLKLHPELDKIRLQLLSRGRKALKLYDRKLVEYMGHALREATERKGLEHHDRKLLEYKQYVLGEVIDGIVIEKFRSHGRVMLDPLMYDKMVPNNKFVPKSIRRLKASSLSEISLMILNSTVYGFSLGDKIWGAFSIDGIEEVKWDYSIFESLILLNTQKDFIYDLVKGHGARDENSFDDFVHGKGKGLVGLLSGPPGVGKTLTAEAVAEATRRPLYTVSSSELGENSSTVSIGLKRILEYAEAWDAVVLLDEADVFLARRDDKSLDRNAIISIFRHELEYYQGILILTTNHLERLDDALWSRIHFLIDYPPLDTDARQYIWRSFIQKTEAVIYDKELYQLAQLNLDGRQIKNIMSMSQSIAKQMGEALTFEGIQAVMDLS